ncbi:MAG: SLC13 family permease, partial [Promethearchaeia archaeon]
SGENIIISTYFNLDTFYFFQNFWIFSFFLLFVTIFLIDTFLLNKEPKIEEAQKRFVLDLIDADVMIENKKMFYFNSVVIIITIALFAILPYLYLTATFSALFLVLTNKAFTNKSLSDLLRDVEWEIIFFFIALYIVIGCLLTAGFKDLFENIPFEQLDPFILGLILLVGISLISGLVANTPTALVFIPIIDLLIKQYSFPSVPLIFAFLIGINIGGNLIPQGAACDMMTLKIAQKNNVENLNFKRLLKTGATFAGIHILFSMGYLFLLTFFFV